METRTARRAGFTLIEIMLVVVIIGILAAVAVPKITHFLPQAQAGATRGTIKALDSAIDAYMLAHNGKLPNSLQDLLPLLKNAKSVPKDGWGQDFVYTPNQAEGSYKIVSPGADNIMGNEDDVTN